MSKKRSSLAEALNKPEPQKQNIKPEQRQNAAVEPQATVSTYSQPPSRRGKKPLTVYLDPAVIKQLKIIGIETETTNQDMVIDALNDFFTKHGKPPIA